MKMTSKQFWVALFVFIASFSMPAFSHAQNIAVVPVSGSQTIVPPVIAPEDFCGKLDALYLKIESDISTIEASRKEARDADIVASTDAWEKIITEENISRDARTAEITAQIKKLSTSAHTKRERRALATFERNVKSLIEKYRTGIDTTLTDYKSAKEAIELTKGSEDDALIASYKEKTLGLLETEEKSCTIDTQLKRDRIKESIRGFQEELRVGHEIALQKDADRDLELLELLEKKDESLQKSNDTFTTSLTALQKTLRADLAF